MPNMSYCRFQNTSADLLDCYEHLEDDLSEDEYDAKLSLIRICIDIVEEHGYEVEPKGA